MTAQHRVAVLAQDHVYPFELGIPARVFAAAEAGYEVLVCTPDGKPVVTNAGFRVTPDHGPEVLASADTVIVLPVDAYRLTRQLPPLVREALAMIPPGTRVVSICTGGFTLASAGLLTGRRVTTHWECAPLFRSWFPDVELQENVLFVHDGDIHTSAGAAAGIDLCLDLVRADHGARVASRAARRCVVSPFREGGQVQFIERPISDTRDTSTAPAREWALSHLNEKITVADLARLAHMSERTLVRRFTDETGVAPRRWLTLQRLARARELLEESELPIEVIATAVGYATATSLRNHLTAEVGLLPAAYRRTFHRPAEIDR
ncbi:GlxA family transcriptional regulator [Branchiibius sp. NY16-3462-2]|uniref:GlxA family transcriptional regulator n=1 Tax=Branchiibius sp. NY16-3462-2 TaxID=1807500 RepID=UPI00079C1372|nr:helix-turn-helix domain-containing protein [Branchiibius sp. NY16-3462-2]KYH43658.1 AraC family transcriptional regulator [Branchiibius sp. NY16-3462-2]